MQNIGAIEANKPVPDNDWETVKKGGAVAIEKWIDHEIIKSWENEMGVVGLYIHGLKNSDGKISTKGKNPFTSLDDNDTGEKLSSIVECHNPAGSNSQERYEWIKQHLADVVAEANEIHKANS